MAAYKTADFFLQVLLIIIFIFMTLIGGEDVNGFLLILIFAVVQVISIILHLLVGPQPWKSPLRKIHHIGTLLVLLALVVAFLAPNFSDDEYAGLGIMIIAATPAAILALFYTVITYLEWRKLRKPQ